MLKECPFCGGKARMHDMGSGRKHIECTECMCQLGQSFANNGTEEELIKLWNNRHTKICS